MYNLLLCTLYCVHVSVFYIITTAGTIFQHVEFAKRGDTYFRVDK